MKVNRILLFWRGLKIPQWRKDCTEKLLSFYPNAEVISNIDENTKKDVAASNNWRFEQIALTPYTLWVDNDIFLYFPLELTETPGCADEFHCFHWSILWSGSKPEVFSGASPRTLLSWRNRKDIDKIKVTGIHYRHNGDIITKGQKNDY